MAGTFPVTETYNEEAFPSGQRGQTVNLLHLCFGGPNPPASTKNNSTRQACAIIFGVLFIIHYSLFIFNFHITSKHLIRQALQYFFKNGVDKIPKR